MANIKCKKKVSLFDSLDLISKLKPAFEQDMINQEDNSDEFEVKQKLEELTVSSTKSCSTCGTTFESVEEQRAHFKLDWHRFNIANKLKGLKAISEEQFEDQCENLSLSGSESESEQDKLEEATSKLPKIFLSNTESGQVYSIHKSIWTDFSDPSKATKFKWAFFMLGGGHFAGAIFQQNTPILHKTFHCYTVRAKQGGSQNSADNKSGGSHAKSAGASLRRYNEASFSQHIQDILSSWKSELSSCSLIFFRAVSGNRKILFSAKPSPRESSILDRNDPRLISIPFPTRRATFKEVKRVHEVLSTMTCHEETLDQLKAKLLDSSSSPSRRIESKNSARKGQIRRSKSREKPHRALPDFVQSLADEAQSESEPEQEVTSNLQEFEVTKKISKKEVCQKVETQNSLVTACKSGDLKLFNLLATSGKLEGIINEPLGENRLTFLHIAAKEGHDKIISALLENGADPSIKDKSKKTAYACCPEKNSRLAFRRFQASNPDLWDYVKAGLPKEILTLEEEARQASKKAEKKKAQRLARKEKEKEVKEVEKLKKQEEMEKQRFLNLSDREKRALAAERRILASQEALPSSSRCFQCGADISGKVPFEYNEFRFCKPACVKEHRNKNKP